MERGRNAIRDRLAHLPATPGRKDESGTEQVAVAELAPCDVVVIRPGTRIPVDDEVVPGHALVDQSTITGEPLAVEKAVGTGFLRTPRARPAPSRSIPNG
jgi:P-type E1-E2 ATPase